MATQVTARRGASDCAPENTLAAIHQAVESGADRIEVDVHASRDGRLVLHHFYALGETDDGVGLVFERDAAYLRTLDVGSWFDPVYRGERILFLEEVFAAVGHAVEYELDLKGFTLPFLDAVLALTHRYGVFDQTEFTSHRLFLLTHLKRREAEAINIATAFAHQQLVADVEPGCPQRADHCPDDSIAAIAAITLCPFVSRRSRRRPLTRKVSR